MVEGVIFKSITSPAVIGRVRLVTLQVVAVLEIVQVTAGLSVIVAKLVPKRRLNVHEAPVPGGFWFATNKFPCVQLFGTSIKSSKVSVVNVPAVMSRPNPVRGTKCCGSRAGSADSSSKK